jgi:hypothetical protein
VLVGLCGTEDDLGHLKGRPGRLGDRLPGHPRPDHRVGHGHARPVVVGRPTPHECRTPGSNASSKTHFNLMGRVRGRPDPVPRGPSPLYGRRRGYAGRARRRATGAAGRVAGQHEDTPGDLGGPRWHHLGSPSPVPGRAVCDQPWADSGRGRRAVERTTTLPLDHPDHQVEPVGAGGSADGLRGGAGHVDGPVEVTGGQDCRGVGHEGVGAVRLPPECGVEEAVRGPFVQPRAGMAPADVQPRPETASSASRQAERMS